MEQCDLRDIECSSITEAQGTPVTPDLIFKTSKGMKKNKAPGPDGFTLEFFLGSWELVGQDFCKAIMTFFESGKLHPNVNSTSIALIPKISTPTHMRDIRPISSCSVAYKCIAKIMDKRPSIIDSA